MKRKPSAKPPKSKRPAKVRAIVPFPAYAVAQQRDGAWVFVTGTHGAPMIFRDEYRARSASAQREQVVAVSITLTPKARPRNGK